MNNDMELTLLSEEEIWGDKALDVIKKYGRRSAITDLAILTGAWVTSSDYWHSPDDNSLKGRTGQFYYTKSLGVNDGCVRVVADDGSGERDCWCIDIRSVAIRPALLSSKIFSQISANTTKGYNGVEEVLYGEYPQYAPDSKTQETLEKEYKQGRLQTTGCNYTFNKTKYNRKKQNFQPLKYNEYVYQGRKYIRVKSNPNNVYYNLKPSNGIKLSNDKSCVSGDFVWVEVSPVKWLVDKETGMLLSKVGLLSGIRFNDKPYDGNFNKTEMKEYLDKYMLHDLTQHLALTNVQNMTEERNPYNFDLTEVSEEDIIKGAIESNIPVFLHGKSSEGKSARIKQIDPTLEIIYLRNATPDSLNGKSALNPKTGEMMDIKPTWLKKLEEKCTKEPDRSHIVFFDEITNALPSIQGMAFNIVLDREVNGIWKLPENARIVAAGNEMNDSLAASKLAEPLFNRFAHVYIKTTTEGWLKWASENNIHPAIYSYIAYKNGQALRSEYNGETPNADPRKWEMASKMLYKTGNPEMLRALVGKEITREFVAFCNQKVITLEDVINGNYNEEEIESLNTAERYATTMGLSMTDESNLEKVRNFVTTMGAEFGSIFDALWTHGEEERLEQIAEIRLERGIKK